MERRKDKKSKKRPDTPPANRPDKKIRIAVVLLAIVVLGCAIFFGTYLLNISKSAPAQGTISKSITVYYFYGAECPHCHDVTPYVQSLVQKYPDVNFQILEEWHNTTNSELAKVLFANLNQTQEGVPEAIVGDVVLSGSKEIPEKLEGVILNQTRNLTGSSRLAASLIVSESPAAANSSLTATFFYGDGCSHCESVKPLVAALQTKYPELHIEMLEVNNNKANLEKFLAMRDQYGLESVTIPTIFIGESALVGETEVKDHFEEKILAEKQRIASSTPANPVNLTPPSPTYFPEASNVSVNATFFYANGCSHCENVKPLIADLQTRYPELHLEMLEVNQNETNLDKFLAMRLQYGLRDEASFPAVFIGESALVGETEIKDHFEEKILAEKQRIATSTNTTPVNLTPGGQPETSALSPYMVVFAALVDSINPCGLSVLVFLLISMAAAGNRRRILLVGGVYIAAMFLFHFFVGIGLFSAVSLSGLSKPFSIIGGIIALAFGIITLADVLRNKETYLLSIPESGKGMLGTYIRKATLPAAFILGILAGILGFSCTGGIYISILGLMGRDMTVMAGLPYLVLYNLIFVLPLVLVTLLVAYGISPDRAERWRTENKRTIRIIIGVILVALGLVILLGWFG